MNRVNRIIKAGVFTNVWISLCAGAATYQTVLLLGDDSLITPIFVAAATLFTYNFQRLVKLRNIDGYDQTVRNQWLIQHRKPVYTLTALSALTAGYLILFMPLRAYPVIALGGVISIAYAVRFIPLRGRTSALRDLPGVKLYLIGLIWAVATVLLPQIVSSSHSLSTEFYLLFAERFAFIVALSIPFDIRDLSHDRETMKTLPSAVGIVKATRIALLWILLSGVLVSVLYVFNFINTLTYYLLLLAYMISALVIRFAYSRDEHGLHIRSELYYALIVDGCILLLALAVILGLAIG